MEASLTITQKQIPAQQVIQTMNVLQMNAMELENYINEAALENPVIDLKEEEHPETEGSSREQAIKRKLEWLESADRQNIVYYRDDGEDVDREANWQDIRDKGESLVDHLLTQLMGEDLHRKKDGLSIILSKCWIKTDISKMISVSRQRFFRFLKRR